MNVVILPRLDSLRLRRLGRTMCVAGTQPTTNDDDAFQRAAAHVAVAATGALFAAAPPPHLRFSQLPSVRRRGRRQSYRRRLVAVVAESDL